MLLTILNRFARWMRARNSVTSLMVNDHLYMERFYLFRSSRLTVVLHLFHGPDDRYLHCHPWRNVTVILTGGYKEERYDGTINHLVPGSFSFRDAEVFHRICSIDTPGSTWSLFIMGKRKRIWGEIIDGVWSPVITRLDEGMEGHVFPRRKEPKIATADRN